MSIAVEFAFNYTIVHCYKCSVAIPMPNSVYNRLRNSHGDFYCINGHCQHFTGQSDADKLKTQLESVENRLHHMEQSRDRERRQKEYHARSASSYKGQITRIKNRVGNGVCPCCNRSFQNLMHHMETKHPNYKDEGGRHRT